MTTKQEVRMRNADIAHMQYAQTRWSQQLSGSVVKKKGWHKSTWRPEYRNMLRATIETLRYTYTGIQIRVVYPYT